MDKELAALPKTPTSRGGGQRELGITGEQWKNRREPAGRRGMCGRLSRAQLGLLAPLQRRDSDGRHLQDEEALNEENESPRDGGQGEGGLWPGAGVSRERSERLRGRWRGLSGEAAWRVVAPPLGGRRLATEP
ncbi:unnamed protein product [Lampetra fluviatilis]